MGYCTYTPARNGSVVVAWIGTGKDYGCQKTITYNKSARLADVNADRNLKCKDAANQFVEYVKTSRCRAEDKITPIDVIKKNLFNIDKPQYTGQTEAEAKAARHKIICAKNCGLDPVCNYDKLVEQCGGGTNLNPCSAFPPPFNNCAYVALGIIVLAVGLMVLK